MIFIIFTFLIFGGWYVWVKIRGTDMVKVKFDYTTKKTSRISTWKIIVAVLFLMLIFILAFTSDSMQTSAGRKVNFLVVGIVVCIYIAVILFFNIQRIKIKKFKKNSIKLPGKIIGLKTHRFYNYNSADYNFTYYLIVNYVNPQTGKTEEYTTRESVNASPFYALKSLDVSVYYKDREHIWVNDFKRIKKLQENIAFQVTGYVDGKDPGVLKYVED